MGTNGGSVTDKHVPVELHDKILRAAYLLHGQYAQDYHRMGVLNRKHRAFLNAFEKLYPYDFDNYKPCFLWGQH